MSPDATLYWSRRGEVACAAHAPAAGSERWKAEGWKPLFAPHRFLLYQCQHCHGTPIAGPRHPGTARRRPTPPDS